MNIFYLDQDIQTCVEYHCDKHVVKMPLETTQMLCTVYHRYGAIAPYKPVHAKHPCTLWAGNNVLNYKLTHTGSTISTQKLVFVCGKSVQYLISWKNF